MTKARELADLIANVNKGSSLGNKNFIINGAAQVQQRGDLSISAGVTNEGFAPDRFHVLLSNMGQLAGTFTTVADAPDNTGLTRSIKWTTTTPENSIDSNELYSIRHNIEAQNLQSLEYGTSDAKYTTLSFWVKSSVTGTFGITLYAPDANQTVTNTYTIASANTWQYVTWTIPPNTSGTINNDNGEGLRFIWQLASGSTYDGGSSNQNNWISHVNGSWAYGHAQDGVVTTDNATFQLTGLQYEIGEKATEFEHESYSVTLEKASRYYHRITFDNGSNRSFPAYNSSTTQAIANHTYPVTMRTRPTAIETNGTASDYDVAHTNTATNCSAVPSYNEATIFGTSIVANCSSGLTAGQGSQLRLKNSGAYLAWSAEL